MFEAAGPYFLRRSQSQGLLENYIDPAAGVAGNFLLSLPLERIGLKHISMPCSLPGSSLKGKYKRSPPCNLRKKHRFIPQCNLKKRGERRNTRVVFFFFRLISTLSQGPIIPFWSKVYDLFSSPSNKTEEKKITSDQQLHPPIYSFDGYTKDYIIRKVAHFDGTKNLAP